MNNLKRQNQAEVELSGLSRLVNYGLLILLAVLILSLTRNIYRMKETSSHIIEANDKLAELKLANEELNNKLDYVTSDIYLEKEARNKLGLAKEGEIVLVLPEDEILRRLAPNYEEFSEKLPDPNWKKWWEMFN